MAYAYHPVSRFRGSMIRLALIVAGVSLFVLILSI